MASEFGVEVPISSVMTPEQQELLIRGTLSDNDTQTISVAILGYIQKGIQTKLITAENVIGIGGWTIDPLNALSLRVTLEYTKE